MCAIPIDREGSNPQSFLWFPAKSERCRAELPNIVQRLSNREREGQRRKHRIFYRDMRGIGEDEDENDEEDDEKDEDEEKEF